MRNSVRPQSLVMLGLLVSLSLLACKEPPDPSDKIVSDALTKAFPPVPERCWFPDAVESDLHYEGVTNSVCIKRTASADASARCLGALKEAGILKEPPAEFMKAPGEDMQYEDKTSGRLEVFKPRRDRYAACAVGGGDGLKVRIDPAAKIPFRPHFPCGSRASVVSSVEKESPDRARVHYEMRLTKSPKQNAIDAACGEIPFDPTEKKNALLVKVNGAWTVAGAAPGASASATPSAPR